MSKMTPMLKQYMGIKSEYADAILFYRMGDFYEMFFDDAKVASRILGITLTSRGTYNGEKVPMCGVPYHSAGSYVAKLVEEGWKVAICEQTGDPKASKGVVKREVVRVVTPGSVVEEVEVDGKNNLFMAAVTGVGGPYGLAHLDLSTGEFRVTEAGTLDELLDELGRIDPVEVLLPEKDLPEARERLAPYRLELLHRDDFLPERAEELLLKQFGVHSLDAFGCQAMDQGIVAAGAVVHYLLKTQKGTPRHIKGIVTYRLGDFMFLDEATTLNLELFRTMRRRSTKGTLFHILDRTVTPMGSRLLKRWIGYPLLDLDRIRKRLAGVSCFREDRILREEVREQLRGIYDLERLNGRISMGRANARDLVALKSSLRRLPSLKTRLDDSPSELVSEIAEGLDPLQDVADWIEEALREDPPLSIREGGIIKEGYHPELDRLISVTRDGKKWIAELVSTEQERTGISNLKIGYNRVFGYYIEISKSNLHLVPPDYIRKQTLVNGERFITETLKEYEELVLGAEEKRAALEYELFEEVRKRVAAENGRIQETAKLVGELDVLAALAEAAEEYGYTYPEVNDGKTIEILDGRHPVIEQTVKDEDFVPNDIRLDDRAQQFLIITGPNMAGKSTILRQTALTVLMAQMGSFVPASKAVIGLVDRIFTRIGASDDLARGRSTFMVEMNETANILRHATTESLVILDEIGRGTSTYDGLSIAWAVAEALHDRNGRGVRTLFATHYHELTELVTTKPRVKNFNIAVREWNGRIIFLRKLVPGGTSRSYGIEVARIAGLPQGVIDRAKEILRNLEGEERDEAGRPMKARSGKKRIAEDTCQLSLFGGPDHRLRKWILDLDIPSMAPLEALIELDKLRKYVEEHLT
ncbi:MAG: DNA mismatch repair protein MutS [Deltaproteobacteria bacterium]|nr:DNA mismatch repair protein MutS [Deltaproteobacteria bacterium]MBW2128440.1 DNA mismatch repair protein MutS [Deltaproteobacteria bacterium]MBW2303506.1 DNA mismatch repair protein MutS [Deltaproteobacteria bacterium]